jgi:hypothetical protein
MATAPREKENHGLTSSVLRFCVTFSDANVNYSENLFTRKEYAMIEAKPLSRSFTYNGVKLPDPDPRMTAEEVKSLYSHQY